MVSDFEQAGDQPTAVATLTESIKRGDRYQTLLGITGSGKSATIGWTIEQVQRPTLVLAPNKSLAAQLAKELGVDFGFQLSASAVFREIAATIPAYAELRYPLLKDESHPVQVKHAQTPQRDLSSEVEQLKQLVRDLPADTGKQARTPDVGHELFKPGTLTGRVPQFPLLASGNPRPETLRISPLYQIKGIADLRLPVGD